MNQGIAHQPAGNPKKLRVQAEAQGSDLELLRLRDIERAAAELHRP